MAAELNAASRWPVSRALLILAALVIVLAGMRTASPMLGPLLLALFIALLCEPFHAWLLRHRVPGPVAIVLVALLVLGIVTGLTGIVAVSTAQFVRNAERYQVLLARQLSNIHSWLEQMGWEPEDPSLQGLVSSRSLMNTILSMIVRFGDLAGTALYTLLAALFLLIDGPGMMARLRLRLGEGHPLLSHLQAFGRDAIGYFRVRTYGNAITGAGVWGLLIVMGIDLAALWAVLTFLLSYIPYVGLLLAGAPPVILALAVQGPGHALLVAAGIVIINALIENLIIPRMLSRSFSLPISVIFVSLFFWTWLIGPPGVILAVVLTRLVILVLASFEESRWISVLLAGSRQLSGEEEREQGPPASREGAEQSAS